MPEFGIPELRMQKELTPVIPVKTVPAEKNCFRQNAQEEDEEVKSG